MQYPFIEGKKYLTAEELAAFDAFMADEPIIKDTYTNEKDEKRRVLRIWYPQGVKTHLTAVLGGTDKNGRGRYHTPCATLEPLEKFARVAYDTPDGGGGYCNSEEWFTWLGKKFEQKKPKPKPQITKEKAEAIVAMHERSIPAKGGDAISKGAKWSKPKNKKS